MRKTLLKLHLWTALAASLVVACVAVTGCLLVFELKMDGWLDPAVYSSRGDGKPASFAPIVAAVSAAFPGQRITEVNMFGPDSSIEIRLEGGVRAFADRFTGSMIGSRTGEPPSYWVRHVHRELVGGKAGVAIVRIVSVVVIFQCLSGLWLWFPLKRLSIRTSASWRRINFDTHYSVGFLSSLLVCVLAVTGLVKSYGAELQPLADRLTGEPAVVRDGPSDPQGAAGAVARIGLDDALAAARQALPGAWAARITPPKSATGSYAVTMKFPGDVTAPGRSWAVIDQYTGKVLRTQDSRTAPAGARVQIVNRAIHVGGFAGVASRLFAFLVSASLLVQLVSGVAMWWQKIGGAATRSV